MENEVSQSVHMSSAGGGESVTRDRQPEAQFTANSSESSDLSRARNCGGQSGCAPFHHNGKVKVGHAILCCTLRCLFLPWAGCVFCETLVKLSAKVTSIPKRGPQTEKIMEKKSQMFKTQEEPT